MKNDAQIKATMNELLNDVQEWVSYVEGTGNQCAFSDRQLERVIAQAAKIKKLYEANN